MEDLVVRCLRLVLVAGTLKIKNAEVKHVVTERNFDMFISAYEPVKVDGAVIDPIPAYFFFRSAADCFSISSTSMFKGSKRRFEELKCSQPCRDL